MYMSGKQNQIKNLLQYSSIYQPKPIENDYHYSASYPEQRYRPDNRLYDSRIKIYDKFGTTQSLRPTSKQQNQRHTSAKQFKLLKEKETIQVKPYSKLNFTEAPVSAECYEIARQTKIKTKQQLMKSNSRKRVIQDKERYYNDVMNRFTDQTNTIFEQRNGRTDRKRKRSEFDGMDQEYLKAAEFIK